MRVMVIVKADKQSEAIDWLKRAPFDGGTEVEIRQVFESEDFGEALTPQIRALEDGLREQLGWSDKPKKPS